MAPPPTDPPAELAALAAAFAADPAHRPWSTADGAFGAARAASEALVAAGRRAGLAGRVAEVAVQRGVEAHAVALFGDWYLDATARQFRPNDPAWPRLVPASQARAHYGASDFQDRWIALPVTRERARAWAAAARVALVREAAWLHVAVGHRRRRGFPLAAVALLGLPPDPEVPTAEDEHRVGEVAPLWRRDDPDGADAAGYAVARAAQAARAMGYARLVAYAPLDAPFVNRRDPDGGPAWDDVRLPLPRWRVEDVAGDGGRLLRRPGTPAGARAEAARRWWANESHAADQFDYEGAVAEAELRLGRELTDEEAYGVADDLGLREPPIAGDAEAPGDPAPIEMRYALEFARPAAGLRVVPLAHGVARGFVNRHHAHHWAAQGEVFALGVLDEAGDLRCAATLGRPVSQELQAASPLNAEVTRVACARGPGGRPGERRPPPVGASRAAPGPGEHAESSGSKVLGAVLRAAAALGYTRLISYTLLGESGASYRAAGWTAAAESEGGQWGSAKRPRRSATQTGPKVRWEAGPDARVPAPEAARAIAERVAAHAGAPLPGRGPRPVPRYLIRRRPDGGWSVLDDDTGAMLPGGGRRAAAEAVAARLNRVTAAGEALPPP